MAFPFTKFITREWVVLTSKIDKLFIVIGIIQKPAYIVVLSPQASLYTEVFLPDGFSILDCDGSVFLLDQYGGYFSIIKRRF